MYCPLFFVLVVAGHHATQGTEDPPRVQELERQVCKLEQQLSEAESDGEKRLRKMRQEFDRMKAMFEERCAFLISATVRALL